MGIFKIRDEIVNKSGITSHKWRVYLCDSIGDPIEDYYANFLADFIVVKSTDVKTSSYLLNDHPDKEYRSYECEDILVQEDEKGTTVIFS